jgi:alanyl-tRNA synthetase
MLSDKDIKKRFKLEASKYPEKYYAVNFLKKKGFFRGRCSKCKKFFWSTNSSRKICGDSACEGMVSLFDNKSRKKMSYEQVWIKYAAFFRKRGYKVINRYPVVARWNPTIDFTIASIAAFQPHVVSGESLPPAKKLVIPQFCLRFGDIDNVGVTGSHNTGFVMLGQHAFVTPSVWNQEKFFRDIFEYALEVVGLSKDELTLHEDAWAGGGNFGPCMEFFAYGIELFNQVYMLFEQDGSGRKELKQKVLDMGLGMERIAWFSQGTVTMYDAVFPEAISFLKKKTRVVFDFELFKKFAPYASLLNLDEVEDIDSVWADISSKLGIECSVLKSKIRPMTGIYSVAEHSRSLLFAIADGSLPSNVGGSYNLRVIFRRALSFIDEFGWKVDFNDLIRIHAKSLRRIFPELEVKVDDVCKILDFEKKKYVENRLRSKILLGRILKSGISEKKLFELYDSHGITPDIVRMEASRLKIKVVIPNDFYKQISERHEKSSKTSTRVAEKFNIDVVGTTALYFDDYLRLSCNSTVLKTFSVSGKNYVVLDKTVFYPTSGGQLHDIGSLSFKSGSVKVVNVIKQGKYIIHLVSSGLKKGLNVSCLVDKNRRVQLAQHHSTAHILNAACRKVLGEHIWQAGAAKTLEKGRLDITHFEIPSNSDIKKIEVLANKIVKSKVEIKKSFMSRSVAEKKYGFSLYQGGVAPGQKLRIVDITGLDVEACGGTHLNNTSEAGLIKIIKVSKVQDGIIRLEFVSGSASVSKSVEFSSLIKELEALLGVDMKFIPGRVLELFSLWKKVRKFSKKGRKIDFSLVLKSDDMVKLSDEQILVKTALVLNTQKEHLVKTISRFLKDLKK